MVYNYESATWKNGITAKTDAKVAARVMGELSEHGMLTAQGLVDASRPEDAPMHKDFEWDNEIAGEQWRRQQARTYIGGIVYLPVESKGEQVRMFYNLKTDGPVYTAFESIMKSSDSMEVLRKQAAEELARFKNKYSVILKIVNAMQDVESMQMKLNIQIPAENQNKAASVTA